MIRLFIADDHSVVREGLKFVVAACRDIEVVGEAEDAASLFAGVERLRPDVALVDVTMPGPGIIEVIRRLKSTRRPSGYWCSACTPRSTTPSECSAPAPTAT